MNNAEAATIIIDAEKGIALRGSLAILYCPHSGRVLHVSP